MDVIGNLKLIEEKSKEKRGEIQYSLLPKITAPTIPKTTKPTSKHYNKLFTKNVYSLLEESMDVSEPSSQHGISQMQTTRRPTTPRPGTPILQMESIAGPSSVQSHIIQTQQTSQPQQSQQAVNVVPMQRKSEKGKQPLSKNKPVLIKRRRKTEDEDVHPSTSKIQKLSTTISTEKDEDSNDEMNTH
ncbi:hypothetical protein EIN_400240 [Entamoeba invadens IP1]|uniref:Uncharacterized protein n=1 Tax=Entamoeba invadens IP1 TaxID=370355 RepID=A0A0A1UFV2_ENTIV|nr:hypothetical protein EIN_400240 [Entamoeba invadens IP1]ELP91944.1 hypothetical protein EIN_400240 [Entamoeba invadens IP1]|eukprot:XP_004258715.1 hypothetical protein EIN_400240 [Entamoeba invadens IP1]